MGDENTAEFQKPFSYRLKVIDDEDNNYSYRYRLLNNLSTIPYNVINPEYSYFFGIFPCEYIPSAYIPFNYKKFSHNFNRISKNDNFTNEQYKKIFGNFKNNDEDKIIIREKIKNILRDFENKKSLYNVDILPLAINLIIIWTFTIIIGMYIIFYYYSEIFNYILAGILILALAIAIILKMIYTIQN